MALRERADRDHCNQSDVVAAALHRELSPELFDRKWASRLATEDGLPTAHVDRVVDARRQEPAAAGHRTGR